LCVKIVVYCCVLLCACAAACDESLSCVFVYIVMCIVSVCSAVMCGVCKCLLARVHVYIFLFTRISMCVHTYIQTCICIYRVHTCTCMCVCVHVFYTGVYLCLYILDYLYSYLLLIYIYCVDKYLALHVNLSRFLCEFLALSMYVSVSMRSHMVVWSHVHRYIICMYIDLSYYTCGCVRIRRDLSDVLVDTCMVYIYTHMCSHACARTYPPKTYPPKFNLSPYFLASFIIFYV